MESNDMIDKKKPIQTLEDLLSDVTEEIAKFDAQKLAVLKKDIETFLARKKATVEEYSVKYAELSNRWSLQNDNVKDLWSSIDRYYPDDGWKDIAKPCIGKKISEISAVQAEIDKRTGLAKGRHELERDAKKTAADLGRAYLDGLIANTKGVDGRLTENAKLIEDVRTTLNGKDRAVAIYDFFYQLLPSHVQLTPELADKACTDPLDTMEMLTAGAAWETVGKVRLAAAASVRAVPWLIDPAHFALALDSAWNALRDAQNALGHAEGMLAKDPDDLVSLTKKLVDLRKSLDGDIRACLKAYVAVNPCETPTEPTVKEA